MTARSVENNTTHRNNQYVTRIGGNTTDCTDQHHHWRDKTGGCHSQQLFQGETDKARVFCHTYAHNGNQYHTERWERGKGGDHGGYKVGNIGWCDQIRDLNRRPGTGVDHLKGHQ